MGTFSTKKILYGSTSLIPTIANRIQEEFQRDGYEVAMNDLSSGGYDISITKGGLFKAVLGMKTALKVTADLRTGVGIQADIRTVLADCMYTICTAAALNTQRTADIRNRKRTC